MAGSPALDPTKGLGGFLLFHSASEGWKKRWVSEVDGSLLVLKKKFDAHRLGVMELATIKHIQLGAPGSARALEFSLLSGADPSDKTTAHLDFRAESTGVLNYWLKGIESRTNASISYKTKEDVRRSSDALIAGDAAPPADPADPAAAAAAATSSSLSSSSPAASTSTASAAPATTTTPSATTAAAAPPAAMALAGDEQAAGGKRVARRNNSKRMSVFGRLQGAISHKGKEHGHHSRTVSPPAAPALGLVLTPGQGSDTSTRPATSRSATDDDTTRPPPPRIATRKPGSHITSHTGGGAAHKPPAKDLPPPPPKKPLPAVPPPKPSATSIAPLPPVCPQTPTAPPVYTKPPLRQHRRSGSEGWNRSQLAQLSFDAAALRIDDTTDDNATVDDTHNNNTTTATDSDCHGTAIDEAGDAADDEALSTSSGLPKGLPPAVDGLPRGLALTEEQQLAALTQVVRVRTTDEAIFKKVNLVNVQRSLQIDGNTTAAELHGKMVRNLCRGMDAHLVEYLQRTVEHAALVVVRDDDPESVMTLQGDEYVWDLACDPAIQFYISVSPTIVKLLFSKQSTHARRPSTVSPPLSPRRPGLLDSSPLSSPHSSTSPVVVASASFVGSSASGGVLNTDATLSVGDDQLFAAPGLSLPVTASASGGVFASASATVDGSSQEEEPLSPDARLFRKRTNVAREIVSSERTYYKVLVTAIEVYRDGLMRWLAEDPGAQAPKGLSTLLSRGVVINEEAVKTIFGNLNIIRGFHETFLSDLEVKMQCWSQETTLGDVFKQFAPFLRVYVSYSNNYKTSVDVLSRIQESSPAFNDFLRSLEEVAGRRCGVSSLENMLIQPIQRVPRYVLLLQDLLDKTSGEHPDHPIIADALSLVLAVSDEVDRNIQEHELRVRLLSTAAKISKRSDLVRADRKLIKEATEMCVTPECTKISKRVRLWLFNDIISHVMTTKSSSAIASNKYQWPLTLVWLHDNFDPTQALRNSDKYPYGFSLVGPKKEYQLRFKSADDKQSWLAALRQQIQASLDAVYVPGSEQRQLAVDDSLRYGEFIFQDGSRYEGEWNEGRMHGQGRLDTFGNVYTGTFSSSLRQGQGTLHYATGQTYEGYWHNDRPHGEGVLRMQDGSVYEGQFYAGLMHGRGVYSFRNGDRYEGEWVGNQPFGDGVFASPSRRLRYEGRWDNGCPHGSGTLRDDANASEYVGQFERGRRHGVGELRLKRQGRTYKGAWEFDRRLGVGVEEVHGADGELLERYEGDFENNLRHGQGTVVYFDGSTYAGGWRKGQRHGHGTFTSPVGMVQSYKGEWDRGQMHGKGTLKYQTGFMWAGFVENDSFRGDGILTAPNNAKVEARFSVHSLPEGRTSLWKEDDHHNLVKFSGTITQNDLLIRPPDKTATAVDVLSHPTLFHFTSLSD